MSFPRYESYRKSGIDWISEFPSHWTCERLKTLFKRMSRPPRTSDEIVTAFRDGAVTLRRNRREDGFTVADKEIGYQGVRRGDLVIHAMDGFAGAIGVSDSDGKSTPVYSVCVPEKGAISEYFALILRHMALSGFVTALARGIRERSTEFRWADASVVFLPCPPIEEQKHIVSFVARESTKIDRLIEAQQQLIKLLKEKRRAVISHAVAKGLDPTIPVKPSGVKWLGDMPAHWEMRKFASSVDYQEGPGILAIDFHTDGVPLLRVAGAQSRWASLEGCNYLDPAKVAIRWEHFRLLLGDLIISGSASMGTICEVGSDVEGAIAYTGLIRLRPKSNTIKDYIRAFVVSGFFLDQISLLKAGATIQHFGPVHLQQVIMPLPPLQEQAAIARYIECEHRKLESLLQQAEFAITLLNERRSALISAAVTGEIDARNIAAPSVSNTMTVAQAA